MALKDGQIEITVDNGEKLVCTPLVITAPRTVQGGDELLVQIPEGCRDASVAIVLVTIP